MGFIAGSYTVKYNNVTLGQTEDGINIETTFFSEPIRGDNLGDSDQDGVYRGANCFADLTLLEYDAAGGAAAFWPYTATLGELGVVGTIAVGSSLVKALLLTDVTGTSAEAKPATLTFAKAILAPGFPLRLLFASKLRRVPLRFQCYPDSGVLFTTT